MKTPDAISALAALSQDSRLGIFRLLVRQGPEGLAVGTIAERMGVTGATLSFHLKELAHAGLVSARQDGRFIFYAANYTVMNNLIGYLTENCCQGGECAIDCKPKVQPQRKRA
jgi:ArsR family transcriptional regulator, arsenate/arsenite/antimonite-responsive transcriptional repressor